MLYLSLFCLNLSYKSLVVYKSGGGVVPNSVVYKYSDPSFYFFLSNPVYAIGINILCGYHEKEFHRALDARPARGESAISELISISAPGSHVHT